MNYYQLLPVISLMVNIFASGFIIAKNPNSPVNRAYLFWSLSTILWLTMEVILWGGASPEESHIVAKISSVGWLSVGTLFLNFTYKVTEKKYDFIFFIFVVLAVAFIVMSFSTKLIIQSSAHYFWGNNIIPGVYYVPVIAIILILPIVVGLVILFIDGIKNEKHIRSNMYIGSGALLMLIAGFTTDMFIPDILGYKNFISLAPNLTVVMGIFVFLGIYKHGILIDVETLAIDLFNNVSEGILIIDESGKIVLYSKSTRRFFRGKIHKYEALSDKIKNFKPGDKEIETTIEGTKKAVIVSQSRIKQWGNLSGHLVIIRDLTKKNKLEYETIKKQKLESVGTLAGGIAHDFNNLLTSLLGSISLSKSLIGNEHKAWDVLSRAEEATIKSKQLTNQLVTFAKGGEPIKKPISLVNLVKNAVHFSLSGSNVNYTFVYPENLFAVIGDDGQLRQVVGNLVINAKEAMSEGGVLEIEAGNKVFESDSDDLPAGRYIFLIFRDRGCGIASENLGKIFDPYFTTKETGTGLGLYSSYSIIKKHGGKISVNSVINKGTSFTIYLPASEKTVKPKRHNTLKPMKREGRILFMDDEELIFLTTGKLLANSGYKVAYAADGAAAIKVYKKAIKLGVPFDLILMDLTVQGGMGGEECIREILKIDPNAKAIISSGYSDNPVMSDFKKYGFMGVIVKPYKYSDLLALIDTVIDPLKEISD